MRSYNHYEDLGWINTWLARRDIPAFLMKDVPDKGLIVENVAVGFLAEMKGACFLEAFITNPHAPMKERYQAVKKIALGLKDLAIECGYDRCIIVSNKRSLLKIAGQIGFQLSNKVVMSCSL